VPLEPKLPKVTVNDQTIDRRQAASKDFRMSAFESARHVDLSEEVIMPHHGGNRAVFYRLWLRPKAALGCEAPSLPGFVSFNFLFGSLVVSRAASA
jgi:hypothetical protein